jgi:PAS domain S-box-containing protein
VTKDDSSPPIGEGNTAKTKAELLAELSELQERVQELESSAERRLQLEESVARQAKVLESIFENLGDGVVVADQDGNFVLFNPAAERILGLGMTDVSKEKWTEVYGAYYPDRVTPFPWDEMPLARALLGKETRETEMFIRHPTVVEGVYISVTGTPLLTDGAVRGAVIVFRDITQRTRAGQAEEMRALAEQQSIERRRVEAELEKVRDELVRQTRFSAIGELAASIAHDLRNPLGAIRNSIFYLSRRIPAGSPDWVRHLEIIEKEIQSANRIIDNLLDMSRARAPSKEAVDLARVVHDAFAHLGTEDQIDLDVRLEPDPFVIHADLNQIQRLLGNLLTNAAQAMSDHGRILVEARREDYTDVITVSDQGTGIPAELRERVFEPLFTTRAKGTGLGLAICRRIANRHGGSIELIDTGGKGSRFETRLPRKS